MKKFIIFMCVMMCSITSFAQTIYYQELDNKNSIGVGIDENVTLSIINKEKNCYVNLANEVTINSFTTEKIEKYYIHNITLTRHQYEYYKSLCKHGLVKINKREYTGLKIGSALVGTEWFFDYYHHNQKLPFRTFKGGPKPFFIQHK